VVPVRSARKPWWQQATALVTVSAGGVITGFNFVPGAAATMTSPTSVPLHLLALEQAAQPGTPGDVAVGGGSGPVASNSSLRSAIINVASYYLRLAKTRTPAQMEALIWDNTSTNGADHGASCAAFASLTLELAAQTVGLQSWVTGGTTYPWPLPEWADARVQTNPASPAVTSLVADAQTHGRWHPLGDGYQPQPGDWVIYNGHVEVLTKYSDGVLDTIGADSLPDLTVNAHSSGASLADQGVLGFVDNGNLKPAPGATGSPASAPDQPSSAAPAATQKPAPPSGRPASGRPGSATVPGVLATGDLLGQTAAGGASTTGAGSTASIPGLPATVEGAGAVAIPGATATPGAAPPTASANARPAPGTPAPRTVTKPAPKPSASSSASTGRQYGTPGTRDQQAFISLVAPGAIAAQQRYGVPAAVTIAQAIEESAWGQSGLAAQYHNLFGIKGTGPAGSVTLPTSEYENGQWVTIDAQFRVYHNDAESIADHAELLASSGYYTRAMADRGFPDAFANDLTGVYATDPSYGANLIALMKLYNLYQYDTATTAPAPATTATPSATPTPTPTATPSATPTPTPTVHPATAPASSPGAGTWHASVPGVAAPTLAPATSATTSPASGSAGTIPGLVSPGPFAPAPAHVTPPRHTRTAKPPASGSATGGVPGTLGAAGPGGTGTSGTLTSGTVTTAFVTRGRANTRPVAAGPARYHAQFPQAVTTALFASAKGPLARGEHLYRDVAACMGLGWELLAAVDWMQCKADPRFSPVQGERIGSLNDDGTSYPTKSSALTQCARDLVELTFAVYGIDLTVRRRLSVRDLAAAFAAFRWGAILRRHGVSAMEFPYSVAGLTAQHQKMHWPAVDAPDSPDRPGARFREPFGAVPVVLSLGFPATVQ
jgi:flagellum-specific peptidoglycan hydrolase FlgJ